MTIVNIKTLLAIQARLRTDKSPEPEPLDAEEFQFVADRGNRRRALRPNDAPRYKINIAYIQQRWIRFCKPTYPEEEWNAILKSLSWATKRKAEAFARFLIREGQSRTGKLTIRQESSPRSYMRTFWKLYYNHTAKRIDEAVKTHVLTVTQTEFRHLFRLKRKPHPKPILGSEWFIYLQYYRWVRDESSFNLGLDRLDDATLRLFYI
jgi:hypothetical protein